MESQISSSALHPSQAIKKLDFAAMLTIPSPPSNLLCLSQVAR